MKCVLCEACGKPAFEGDPANMYGWVGIDVPLPPENLLVSTLETDSLACTPPGFRTSRQYWCPDCREVAPKFARPIRGVYY